MKSMRANGATIALTLIFATVTVGLATGLAAEESEPSAALPGQSDARAVEIAQATMAAMGGAEAWNNTRYISWKFLGGRLHVWDKWTGNHRMEGPNRAGDQIVSLININTWDGRIFKNSAEVTDPEELAALLNSAFRSWNNDTYWMFMPYKLLDSGVTLEYLGERPMEDGRAADVLQLTFEEVGDTPDNKYEVFVAKDTGLVEQWTHWTRFDDPEPRFTSPWADWQQFGSIMLATNKGRDRDWSIHVYDELPETVFTNPEPAFQQ